MNRRMIDIIESTVSVPDVLAMHGKNTGRRGRCACPFHASRSDTFSYTDKLFHCFSCGESGGVIQLEALLSGTSEDQACSLLSEWFGLDISDRPLSAEDKENYMTERKVDRDYDEWERDKAGYYRQMTVLFRNIRNVPELHDIAKDLRDWLDENIDEVVQPWKYLSIN